MRFLYVFFVAGDPVENQEFEFAETSRIINGALEVIDASGAHRIYTDRGTGSDQDLAVFQPNLPSGYYMMGHFRQRNHGGSPDQAIQIIKPLVSGAVTAPSYSLQTWNDRGTGGDQDVSFWHVVCPDGYVALGDVISLGYHDPTDGIKSKYGCVRADLTKNCCEGGLLWWDRGSGGDNDGSLWHTQCRPFGTLNYRASYFQAQYGYGAPPAARFNCLK